VERIVRAARAAGLGREKLHDLAVAVAEALSNAAVHGNRLAVDQNVDVTVTVAKGGVDVKVADSGVGFDSTAAPDPTEPTRVLVPGGRGIFLMRRLADSVEYNRTGNAVRLTMRRDRAKG
jgi:serine/threonine-protein kinase RsbW